MADQKTAKTEVKKTELESPHQKIRKIAKRPLKPDSEDCCEGNRDWESVDRSIAFGDSLDLEADWEGCVD